MADEVRYHVPLMHAFRESDEKGDSRKIRGGKDDLHALSEDEYVRRRGLSEAQVREIVLDDLTAIFSTVDLQSAVDIDEFEYVSKSVINFGLYDIMHLTSEDARISEIEANIVAALLAYEPRILQKNLHVERAEHIDDVGQKIRLTIYGEVSNRPANIPIDFTAEVDISSCTASISRAVDRK